MNYAVNQGAQINSKDRIDYSLIYNLQISLDCFLFLTASLSAERFVSYEIDEFQVEEGGEWNK